MIKIETENTEQKFEIKYKTKIPEDYQIKKYI